MIAAARVLKYLKGSPGDGLLFSATSKHDIIGYSDSNWGSCKENKKSISAYCFFIGDNLVSWKSKKQKTVSRSSAEAKYRAIALATCEAKFLRNIFISLGMPCQKPATIFCDNEFVIHIANNPVFHERTKHIDMDCHFVHYEIQDKVIHLLPISSKEQTADLLTKPLATAAFQYLKTKLGMKNLYLPSLRGDVSK
jgi:hypothetical protein